MNMRILLWVAASIALCGCAAGKGGADLRPGVGEVYVVPGKKTVVDVVVADAVVVAVKDRGNDVLEAGAIAFDLSPLGDEAMMLSATSGLAHAVKYDIEMIDRRGDRHYTSSCPLMPGASVFESWGHPIPKLRISNFRRVDVSADLVCK